MHRRWYHFVAALFRTVVYPLLGGVEVRGLENVPKSGPIILAPNHLSNLDPPIAAIHQPRLVHTMSKMELMRIPIFGALLKSIFVYGVRRGQNDTEAIRVTIGFLEAGEPVQMFPEGTRGDGVTIGPMSPGIGMLAKRTGALVVPVGLNGTQIVMPKGRFLGRRHRIVLSYGKPFSYDEVANGLSNAEARAAFATALETRIRALCAEIGLPLRASSESGSTSLESNPSQAT